MNRFAIALAVATLLPLASFAEGVARSFSHTVTPTAARVEPPSGDKTYSSIRCWQAAATPVYFGGKDVGPRDGFAICTNRPGQESGSHSIAGAPCSSDVIKMKTTDLWAVIAPQDQAVGSPAMQVLSCIVVQ